MEQQALLFGGTARPDRRTGEARRGHLDLLERVGEAWTKAWTSMSMLPGLVQIQSNCLQRVLSKSGGEQERGPASPGAALEKLETPTVGVAGGQTLCC